MNTPDKMKPGTLVKYRPHASGRAAGHASAELRRVDAAALCYWILNWTWNEIETKLVGIVLKNLENDRLQVRWFGINKTFDSEYEKYLERVG